MKVISGGQTGVDRTALEIAFELNMQHGGWCPKGRRAEDGTIPIEFELQETTSRNYAVRTRKNIEDADGTLVFCDGEATGGTALTIQLAHATNKPLKVVDIAQHKFEDQAAADEIVHWVTGNQITILNVAGPRLSSSPNLPAAVRPILKSAFQKLSSLQSGKT